jgi:hypothetical protein
MQLSHARPVRSIRFDDPNLVSSAGLVPVMALVESAGLRALVDGHLSVPTDKCERSRRITRGSCRPTLQRGAFVSSLVFLGVVLIHLDSDRSGAVGCPAAPGDRAAQIPSPDDYS